MPVDVRILAATNSDLEDMVRRGSFREDLYYRLKVVTLSIPPLRDREGDVALLAEHYLALLAEEHGKTPFTLSGEALGALARFGWPGNVRQLKNVLESVVVFHPGGEITVDQLPPEIFESTMISGATTPVQPLVGTPRSMDEIERQAVLETLQRTKGHRAEAARLLGIGLRTLQRKLKDYKEQGYWEEG